MKSALAAALITLSTLSPARAVTVPADVKAFERHIQLCNKMAENPPTDEKKMLELEEKLKKRGCDKIEDKEKRLRWKYRNQLKVLAVIEEITSEKDEPEEDAEE